MEKWIGFHVLNVLTHAETSKQKQTNQIHENLTDDGRILGNQLLKFTGYWSLRYATSFQFKALGCKTVNP